MNRIHTQRIFTKLFFMFLFFLISNNPSFGTMNASHVSNQDSIHQLIQKWKQKLSQNPKDSAVMTNIAGLYLELDITDSARFWLNLSREIDDQNPKTYFLLGKIYLKKGKIGIIPLEALLAILKQDNNSKAIKHFQKAIKLKPDYLNAYYFLGIAHIRKEGQSHLEDAVRAYQYILNKNEDFKDTRYQLGIAYHKLGQFDTAISSFKEYYDNHPEDSRPFIELSRIFLETDQPEKASRYFMDGIVKLRDQEMLEELFLEIKDILNPQEKKIYKKLPLEQKGIFFKKFWKERDPTPLTVENERLTEHFNRVQFAKKVYPSVVPPYYDDRGRVYVKYGEPDDKYVHSMSGRQVSDNESWSYQKSIRKGLVFDFVNQGAMYKLVQDLTEAAPAGTDYNSKLRIAADLYMERAGDLGGIYNEFSLSFQENDLYDFVSQKTNAENNAPTEVYHFDYEAEPLPFQMRFAQFRGDDNQSLLEIYHSIVSKHLSFSPYFDEKYISTLTYDIAIFDTLYNEVLRKSDKVNIVLPSKRQIQTSYNIEQTNFLLKPSEKYIIVLRVENPEGNKVGIKKWELSTNKIDSDSLQVSDIELASKIEPTSQKSRFYKNGLKVLPYPFSKLNLKRPLSIYYEIYNLKKDEEGKTHYNVDYKLETIKQNQSGVNKFFRMIGKLLGGGKKQSIASSYERSGDSTTEKEYISFDVNKMQAGVIELSVNINDLVSQKTQKSSVIIELFKSE